MITTVENVVSKEQGLGSGLDISVCGHFIGVPRFSVSICSFCVLSQRKYSKISIDTLCITWRSINLALSPQVLVSKVDLELTINKITNRTTLVLVLLVVVQLLWAN